MAKNKTAAAKNNQASLQVVPDMSGDETNPATRPTNQIQEEMRKQDEANETDKRAQVATWADLAGILGSPDGADLAFDVPQVLTELKGYVRRHPEVMQDVLPRLKSLYFGVIKDEDGKTMRDEHGMDRPTDESFAFRDALKSGKGIGAQLTERAKKRAELLELQSRLLTLRSELGEDNSSYTTRPVQRVQPTNNKPAKSGVRTRGPGVASEDVQQASHQILSYLGQGHGGDLSMDIRPALNMDKPLWQKATQSLMSEGKIKSQGVKRGTRLYLA